ncbi:MAG: hypothetical protein IPM17_10585 [Verrucomicrobia bacterium]|nr:hypothetical protein [Verrucomicrobiota bacterium]
MEFNAAELHVRAEIERLGPLAAFRALIAANDALTKSPDLDCGRRVVTERTAIYTELVRHWVIRHLEATGYDRPVALVALGGTGRGEMAPYSDTDFGLLLEDDPENNPLVERLRADLRGPRFREEYGFDVKVQPFCPDYLRMFDMPQVNSFLDLRALYDPSHLTEQYRERLRATVDRFQHFLHVRQFWERHWEKAAGQCEQLTAFDIKNDGARVFLAAIWVLAGEHFVHSHEIYARHVRPQELAAFDFILRVRSYLHVRRGPMPDPGNGTHPQDQLGFEDFRDFGEWLGLSASETERFEFGNTVRARLLAARRRVACFARGVIAGELERGRRVSPGSRIVFGLGGLRDDGFDPDAPALEKSRAALRLLACHQRHGVPIDPHALQVTFRDAGEWLTLVPELSALFYETEGSLAAAMDSLAQIDGAQARLFPGYDRFEASFDRRVMEEKAVLRGVLERRKLRVLEEYVQSGREQFKKALTPEAVSRLTNLNEGVSVQIEAAQLDAEALAAIRLALHTKRLPVTAEDEATRQDPDRELFERAASGLSGVPLAEYYQPYITLAGFKPETIRLTEFLVEHRRAFADHAQGRLLDDEEVEAFARLCGSELRLRALFVFTCADRFEWHNARERPARWFNITELYQKAMQRFRPAGDPTASLHSAGYSREELEILRDFGPAFFGGYYRQFTNRFGSHLLRLADRAASVPPRVILLRAGAATIIGVAARDYPGLAATITGALHHAQVPLAQAHLFSATFTGLALDFFHVARSDLPLPANLPRVIEDAIVRRLHIADEDEALLPPIQGMTHFALWRPGIYRLQFDARQDPPGLVYAVAYRVFRYLRGNIFGLTAEATRSGASVTIFHSLPADLPPAVAADIVRERF